MVILEMCSDEPRYYGNRAACYMMLGLYRNALIDAKKCIELDPMFLKVHTLLALYKIFLYRKYFYYVIILFLCLYRRMSGLLNVL